MITGIPTESIPVLFLLSFNKYLIKISDKNLVGFSQDLVNKVEELNRKGLKDSTDKLISNMRE